MSVKCATCGAALAPSHMVITIDAQYVAGAFRVSGDFCGGEVDVHFCTPFCVWEGGKRMGEALATGHTVAFLEEGIEQK